MEDFLLYIGKAALALGAFYMAYLALFQHQKHFLFNRIYLPVSFVVSFFIPLVTFAKVRYIQGIPVAATNSFAYLPETNTVPETQFNLEWYHYLLAIYVLGIVVFSIHLLIGHLKAMKIIRFSRLKELFGAQVNLTKKDVHPFSFFSRIVLSEKTLNNPNLKMIVDHEMIHVRERHTLDILFSELLFLFQWFNPFAWLIRDAMRNNLEYLTDHQVAQNHNAEAYQLAMVGLAHKEGVAPFLTALNGSQLKNRIIMMKKKTENRYSLLKQLVVLPLLAILLMGLSNKEVRTEVVQATHRIKVVVDGTELPSDHPQLAALDFSKRFNGGDVIDALGLEDKVVANALSLDENSKEDGVYYIQTSDYVPGTNPEFDQLSLQSEEKKAVTKKSIYAVDGEILSDEEVKNLDGKAFETALVLFGDKATEKYGDVAKDASVIDLKTGASNVKVNMNVSDKEVTVKGKITNEKGEPISNVAVVVKGIPSGTITDASGNYAIKTDENSTLVFSKPGFEKQEVALDGKTEINVILKSDGSSKSDEVKVIGYGSMNQTDLPKIDINKLQIRHLDAETGEAPLYIVDGKEAQNLDRLEPDEIESISVLKNESSTSLYGDKGKNGVVIVETKAAVNRDITKALVIVDGKEYDGNLEDIDLDPNNIASIDVLKEASATAHYGSKGKDGVIVVKLKGSNDFNEKSPLYIIDGEKSRDVDFNALDNEDIQSISILKDASATALYREEAKDGVIRVTTKTDEIKSETELRKFIANRIRYPLKAHKMHKEGIAQLFVTINSNGYVTSVSEKKKDDAIFIQEVVVIGYSEANDSVIASELEDLSDIFTIETKRVMDELPKIVPDQYLGKTLGITVKFILQ